MGESLSSKAPEFRFPDSSAGASLQGAIGSSGSLAPMPVSGPGIQIQGPPAPANLKAMIGKAATDNGVEPALLDALVAAESSYDPAARSRAGALGLTQLMPGTAASLGVQNPMDPEQNLHGGAKYLSQLLKQFGDPKIALAAYNAGPGAVMRAGGIPNYEETKSYVNRVMSLYEQRRAQ
jgi:soluble lytic murein transglycosylase-like protein